MEKEEKIQLKHPQGKKSVSISKDKYDLLTTEILKCLSKKESTFSEITTTVAQNLKTRKVKFDGSLKWYLEWVKLDLEAQQIITRSSKSSPQKYILTNN